jgi:DNA polymerase (family X)
MRKEIPAGVLELLSVPGLRPEKVLKLYSELNIASLEGLEQAARQDRLKNVKGLGAALQNKIIQSIDLKRRGEGQRHLHRAAALLEEPPKRICGGRTPARITPAGDFRRGCELISGLSLVAEVPKLDGEKTIRVSEQLTVHLVEKSRYGITLLLATGSAERVDGLRALAPRPKASGSTGRG